MVPLRALEWVELERLRCFTREDYDAVADLLTANPAVRTVVVPSTSTLFEGEYCYHSRHTPEGLTQVRVHGQHAWLQNSSRVHAWLVTDQCPS